MAFELPETFKDHPALWIGGGVALLVVVYLLSSSGSSASASGPSDAEVSAEAALAEQSAAITAQNSQGQLAFAENSANNAASLQLATLQAQTSTTQQSNAITGEQNLAQITSNTTLGEATMQTQVDLANIASQDYQTNANDETELGSEAIAQGAAVDVAQFETQANVATAQINANTEDTIAGYQAATAVSEAGYQAASTEALANANVAIATGAQGVAQNLGIGQLLGSFLCDERSKFDIRHVGNLFDGQKIYTYRYRDNPILLYIGLMAQEVEKIHPEAVTEFGGRKFVNNELATRECLS